MSALPEIPDEPQNAEAEEEVGYKKPPRHSQFKKGNKLGKGRPKGAKNMKTIVNEAMGQKVAVKIGGKTKKLSKVELAIHQLASKASQGDPKASDKAIALYERYGPHDDADGPEPEKLKHDLDALRDYVAMQDLMHPPEETGSEGDGQV